MKFAVASVILTAMVSSHCGAVVLLVGFCGFILLRALLFAQNSTLSLPFHHNVDKYVKPSFFTNWGFDVGFFDLL